MPIHELFRNIPEVILSDYARKIRNATIPLSPITGNFVQGNTNEPGEFQIEFNFNPEPHVTAEVTFDKNVPYDLSAPAALAQVASSTSGRIIDWSSGQGTTRIKLRLDGTIISGSTILHDAFVLHALNFKEIDGFAVRHEDSMFAGRLIFEIGEFHFVLDQHPEYNNILKHLHYHAGSALTHTLIAYRTDTAQFSYTDLADSIKTINTIFSFIRGYRTQLVLPIGVLDDKGVTEIYHGADVDNFKSCISWFNSDVSPELPRIVSAFCLALGSQRNQLIVACIDVYLQTCRKSAKLSTLLNVNQIIFEAIAWQLYMVETRAFTPANYRRQFHADQKISRILADFNLPSGIPTELVNLSAFATRSQINNAPTALTRIRNNFIHPKVTQMLNISDAELSEAYDLSMHWAELMILKIVRYQGPYFNRITKKVDRLP